MKLGRLLSSLDRPEQETLMFMEVEMFCFNSNVTIEVEFVKFVKFVKPLWVCRELVASSLTLCVSATRWCPSDESDDDWIKIENKKYSWIIVRWCPTKRPNTNLSWSVDTVDGGDLDNTLTNFFHASTQPITSDKSKDHIKSWTNKRASLRRIGNRPNQYQAHQFSLFSSWYKANQPARPTPPLPTFAQNQFSRYPEWWSWCKTTLFSVQVTQWRSKQMIEAGYGFCIWILLNVLLKRICYIYKISNAMLDMGTSVPK